uniref:Arginyl-tRNA--protein transferase 1 n=2 Tax=Arion vulgaris TaxID=1028688 RepID=A0A0B7ANR0_9EUPU
MSEKMETDPTIVEYSAEHERYRCGYCGSENTNYSHGMWAHQMTVKDYQDLIDRGWRRSGMYCYKPTMNLTCCPQYTIRCHALEFKLSKSQKKVIKRVNKFLISGVKPGSGNKEKGGQEFEESTEDEGNVNDVEREFARHVKPSKIILPTSSKKSTKKTNEGVSEKLVESPASTPTRCLSATAVSQEDTNNQTMDNKPKYIPKPGSGPDPSKPKCRKAKEIRAQRRSLKQPQTGNIAIKQKQVKQNQEKSLEEFLHEPDQVETPAHKLEIVLCRTAPESLHSRLSFHESYAIYRKYQMAVHNDECDKFGFKNFLVDSPLEEKYEENGLPEGYGSFHHHYLLDGKLIAVGVLDILPASISSVYLYYDPDYSFMGLGVYSALREIALVRQLHLSAPDLKYYYMGFYIHSCQKMRYKGQYQPSYLVCPDTYEWVPIEKCRPKLDVSKYSRLSETGSDSQKNIDVNKVLVLHKGNMLPYEFYKIMSSHSKNDDEVIEYAGLVGKTCAESMLLVRK